jgi:hypothetical protein
MQYYLQFVLDTRAISPIYHDSHEISRAVGHRFDQLQNPLGSNYGDEQCFWDSIENQYHANLAYHAFAYEHVLMKAEKFAIPYFIKRA